MVEPDARGVQLLATTAAGARREAADRWPQGGRLTGYVGKSRVAVYITTVRERGNKANVATAVRNRSPRPTRFIFEPAEEKKRFLSKPELVEAVKERLAASVAAEEGESLMVMRRPKPEKKPHEVEKIEEHVFRVTSGNGGTQYRVVVEGETSLCLCEGFRNRAKCSHVDAVKSFVAAGVLPA